MGRLVWNLFAIYGIFCTAVGVAAILLMVHGRAVAKRNRRRSQDALIAQYYREGNPDGLAADLAAMGRYAEVQGLKTPRGWRR